MAKRVLAVDEHLAIQSVWSRTFETQGVTLVSANTVAEAEARIAEDPSFDAIIVGYTVPPNHAGMNTRDLVRKIKPMFGDKIVASSSIHDYRQELIEAGCRYGADKTNIVRLVCGLINQAS